MTDAGTDEPDGVTGSGGETGRIAGRSVKAASSPASSTMSVKNRVTCPCWIRPLPALGAHRSGLAHPRRLRDIGRVDGALARYAEEVYDSLTLEHQLVAQRIFIQWFSRAKAPRYTAGGQTQ